MLGTVDARAKLDIDEMFGIPRSPAQDDHKNNTAATEQFEYQTTDARKSCQDT